MKEEIKLFLQKVANDEELQKKIHACKSPEEAYAVASSVQEGFTFEEFVDEMTKLKESIDQDLTDEDLAKAAGGLGGASEVWTGAISVVATFMALASPA